MSFQEKRSLVTVVSGLVAFVIYFYLFSQRYAELTPVQLNDTARMLQFWARGFLIFVPISVAARIVALIAFMIVYRIIAGEDAPDFDDERDKLIELKVNRVSEAIFLVGFVSSMVPIAFGGTVTMMFIVLLSGGLVAEIVGESARIVMYRSGV